MTHSMRNLSEKRPPELARYLQTLWVRVSKSQRCFFVIWALLAPVAGAAAGPAESSLAPTASLERAQRSSPDFLFDRPSLSVGIRGEWVQARTESEIFRFTSDLLTLEEGDLNAPGFAVDVGLPIASRLDTVFGVDISRTSAASNYRDLVDVDGLEIEQTTSLSQVSLSGGLELALMPRGRSVGEYAWIPGRIVPYVGAGGSLLWYRFEQTGDFVDFVDSSIFGARLESSGWTPSAHVFGGIDVGVARRVSVTIEIRYRWANASMGGDYVDFDPIDLTGVRLTGGVQFTF